ncbi:MAG: hypothetical protein GX181_03400 [Synergistaceae bacterium]|nr:hypothetical protein [Synergistaceae bacterium]
MKNFYRKRILQIFIAAVILIVPVPLLNYMVDPYWCFDHEILIGRYQTGFDERQQKTNFLTFNNHAYDTLILGNSRVTYTDPRDVPGNAFNFSTSSMRSSEFLPYLRFISEGDTKPIITMVLGLSFAETNGANPGSFSHPEEYVKNAALPGYRYRTLFSMSLLRRSLSNIKRDLITRDLLDAYERGNRKIFGRQMPIPRPENAILNSVASDVARYREQVYGKTYEYLDLRPTFTELKEAFPDTRFIVFTTPVSSNLLRLLIEEGRLDDYTRWISGVVEVFGEVWNFMYHNDVTMNNFNYKDAHHYSPLVCRAIIRRIYGLPIDDEFEEFGVRVTPENLEEHLVFLRDNLTGQDGD